MVSVICDAATTTYGFSIRYLFLSLSCLLPYRLSFTPQKNTIFAEIKECETDTEKHICIPTANSIQAKYLNNNDEHMLSIVTRAFPLDVDSSLNPVF